MRIQKMIRKNLCFNRIVIQMYNKLGHFVFLNTKDKEVTNSVLFATFDKVYKLDLNSISQKELNGIVYKIAAAEIEKNRRRCDYENIANN